MVPDAPNNPFSQPIIVNVPVESDGTLTSDVTLWRAMAGFTHQLSANWSWGLDTTWTRSSARLYGASSASGSEAVYTGAFDVLRDLQADPLNVDAWRTEQSTTPLRALLTDTSARLDGQIGEIAIRSVLEHIVEHAGDGNGIELFSSGPDTSLVPVTRLREQRRNTDSVYLEGYYSPNPLNRSARCEQTFGITLAGRMDVYHSRTTDLRVSYNADDSGPRHSSTFKSWNPSIGICVRPWSDVMFRASYGTGFLPPALSDMTSSISRKTGLRVVDSRRGNELSGPVEWVGGGNPLLRPEQSQSISAGIVLTRSKKLRFSLDYTHLEQHDGIVTPNIATPTDVTEFERLYPWRVTRAPSTAGDPFGVGPIERLDLTTLNTARQWADIINGELDFRTTFDRYGTLQSRSRATWEPMLDLQPSASSERIHRAGITADSPPKFRMATDVSLSRRGWTLGWSTEFFDAYQVASPNDLTIMLNQGSTRVSSQMYHDGYIRYAFQDAHSSLNVQIELGTRNIFNTRPSFDARELESGYRSPYGDPRMARLYAAFKIEFGPSARDH